MKRQIPIAKRWSRKGECPFCKASSGSSHSYNCIYSIYNKSKLLTIKESNKQDFTIARVLNEIKEYYIKYKCFPPKILLSPDYFIQFCYLTSQIIDKPTIIGIPVEIIN